MNQERVLKIIKAPHISEKTTVAQEKKNEYVFEVMDTATKSEIKDAVQFLFNVKVKSVNIVNVRAKKKMFKGIEGKRKAWKKAYVTLLADQTIDMIGAQ